MAFLKANYYAAFLEASLNSVRGDKVKTQNFINEAQEQGFSLIQPLLTRPCGQFKVNEQQQKIFMPLTMVKGLGTAFVIKMQTLQAKEPFQDLGDLIAKTKSTKITSGYRGEKIAKAQFSSKLLKYIEAGVIDDLLAKSNINKNMLLNLRDVQVQKN